MTTIDHESDINAFEHAMQREVFFQTYHIKSTALCTTITSSALHLKSLRTLLIRRTSCSSRAHRQMKFMHESGRSAIADLGKISEMAVH